MRVRLEDVARATGVSPKTVSRVLNEEPSVKDSTRKKVLAAMEQMNYRPSPAARGLARAARPGAVRTVRGPVVLLLC